MTNPPTTTQTQDLAGGPAAPLPSPLAGAVTILTAHSAERRMPKRATKVHRRNGSGGWETQGYDKLKMFAGRVERADTLLDFMAVLTNASRNPGSIVVAEAIRGEADVAHMRRLTKPEDAKKKDPAAEVAAATLCPHPEGVRWICWEVDHIAALPDWFDPNDLRARDRDTELAEWWIKTHLPECFHNRSAILQWSASALVGNKVSMHLWQWLDRPVARASVKAYASAHWKGRMDVTVWDAGRVHYIAAPIFEAVDGSKIEDALGPWRWQWIKGAAGDACEAPPEWVDQPTWEQQLDDAKAESARLRAEFAAARSSAASSRSGSGGGEASGDETGAITSADLLPLRDLDPKRVLAWASKIGTRCADQIRSAAKGGADGRHPTARSYSLFFGNVLEGLDRMGAALSEETCKRVNWHSEVMAVEGAVMEMESAAIAAGEGDPDRARVVRWAIEMGRLGDALLPDYRLKEKYRESANGAKVIQMKRKGGGLPAYEDQPAVNLSRVDGDGVVMDEDDEMGSHAPPAPTGAAQMLICEYWPGAAVSIKAAFPEGYFASEEGTLCALKKEEGAVQVSAQPILIAGRLTNKWGKEFLRLTWPRSGKWVSHTVPRSEAQDRGKLIKLSDFGAPVHSGNAPGVVSWLAAYEHTNDSHIPQAMVTSQMGWQGEGNKQGFLLGQTWIGINGESQSVNPDHPDTWGADSWMFDASGGDGDIDDARAFATRKGTLEGWIEALAPIAKHPRVMLALYASFAAPLVKILGSRTFILDYAGKAGSGKTTILSIAASVWGDPDESDGGIIKGWSATQVGVERTAACLNNLPIFLNDSNKAPQRTVEKVAYDLSEGEGKSRGAKDGGRQAKMKWRTGVISSGEQRLVDYAAAADAGVRHRVLQLHGDFWGGYSPDVTKIVGNLWRHHGHAGRAWLAYLAEYVGRDTDTWRAEWSAVWQALEAKCNQNTAAVRLGKDLAVLTVASNLAHKVFDLPWSREEGLAAIGAVWGDIQESVKEVAGHVKALRATWDWAVANQEAFYGQRDKAMAAPASGWLGKWEDSDSWDTLAIIPAKLSEVLEKLGFRLEGAQREWNLARWLVPDAEGNPTRPVKVSGKKVRCLVIRRSAIDEIAK